MGELFERRGERALAQQRGRRPAPCRRPGRSARSRERAFSSPATAAVRSARLRAHRRALAGLADGMAEQHVERQRAAVRLRRLQRQHPAGDRARHRQRRERPARRDRVVARGRAPAARARRPGPPPSARARAPTARAPARSRRRRCRSCADRRPRSSPPSRPSPRAHCRPRRARRGRPRPPPLCGAQTTPRRCPAVWRSIRLSRVVPQVKRTLLCPRPLVGEGATTRPTTSDSLPSCPSLSRDPRLARRT